MKIQGNIDYEMLVNEPSGNGIAYQSTVDNDLAGLMIAAQTVENNLNLLKDYKKEVKGKDKVLVAKNISEMSVLLSSLNKLTYSLFEHYEHFKKTIK